MLVHSRPAPPTPRREAFDLYWTFASERHATFGRRLAGQGGPWTSDPILARFKFCNSFRALDRVTQYMIRHVAYSGEVASYADRAFRIVAFRTFSNIETWEGLKAALGDEPTLEDLRSGRFERALDDVKGRRGGLYTGAFILCANKAYGFDEKHRNHVALFRHMFGAGRLGDALRGANSLEAVVRALEAFPLMGPFMAYQVAIDLNYSELMAFSEDDFTQAGPGALRGLRKAFVDLGDLAPADAIRWMVERQEDEFARLGLPVAELFGRRLHAIDCQGLFCELDKYCREAMPGLVSGRKRIKARFTPSATPLEIFLPPKWGLSVNGRATVSGGPVASDGQADLDLKTGDDRRTREHRRARSLRSSGSARAPLVEEHLPLL